MAPEKKITIFHLKLFKSLQKGGSI